MLAVYLLNNTISGPKTVLWSQIWGKVDNKAVGFEEITVSELSST